MEKRNSIYEKESYFFLLWRTVPRTHAPFSVVTRYRLNELEVGFRVSGEAKTRFFFSTPTQAGRHNQASAQ
jgi:hypothetical protein